jgi:DNA-binding XRE family transcriptional regulator
MTSNQYRKHRTRLKLTQVDLASLLSVSIRTIKSRENGGPITEEAAIAIKSLKP